jgi:hypothetical protein
LRTWQGFCDEISAVGLRFANKGHFGIKWLFARRREWILTREQRLVDGQAQLVANIRAPHPENHIRRDIRGVIGDPLQAT